MDVCFDIIDHFKKIETISSVKVFGLSEKTSKYPLFTIAIPTYKRVEYLKEAINSAINQEGFDDYEILIVDNNPERNDETEKLLSSYKNCNLTIQYYKNSQNIGMIGNWNRLYVLSRGKYVVMLHDDDVLYPNYLKSVYHIIRKTGGISAGYYPTYEMGANPKYRIQLNSGRNKYSLRGLKLFDFIKGNILGAPTGLCLRRNDAIELGGFDPHFFPSSDYAFYIKLVYHKEITQIVGAPLLFYRLNESASAKKEILLNAVVSDLKIKRTILSLQSPLKQRIWRCYINTHPYYFLTQGIKLWNNYVSFDVKDELKKLKISINGVDRLQYRIINYSWHFMRKINNSYRRKEEIIEIKEVNID